MLTKEINLLLSYSLENNFIDKKNYKQILKSNFNKKHKLIKKIDILPNAKVNVLNVWLSVEKKMKFKTFLELDIFTDELASHLIGNEKFIIDKFYEFNDTNKALNWLDKLCIFTTYIKVNRIKKNIIFKNDNLTITLNKSKPEKTQRQIIDDLKVKQKLSVLSRKQIGIRGAPNQNPRMAHRVIDLWFDDIRFLQYSPYQYFKKHAIVVDGTEMPMKINKSSLEFMLNFVDNIEEFGIFLNADKSIVGGSILSHMHFQSGVVEFPIYNANKRKILKDVYSLNWYMGTILVRSHDKSIALTKANKIISLWKKYSSCKYPNIYNSKHNTVSIAVRKNKGEYEIYILFRNNVTTKERPTGLFHVPEKYQIIKQENIGIIEACGFGIFPGRLDYNEIKNSQSEEFIKWKTLVKGFKTKKEYREKVLYTFKELLKECDVFKLPGVKSDFLKLVKDNV